ncbi:MAG: hypothetical protein WC972_02400 [Trueperaceae bacterium]
MASNYFEMGRALTGSYHAGLGMYKDRQLREEEAARQAEAHRIQMENARRQQRIAQETDDAFAAYNTLNTQGVVQAPGTGLSVPSAQAIAGGELSGLGSGERGIRDTAGMYQREMGRYPPPPRATPAPGAAPAPAGLPRYDAQAPVDFRPATEIEQEQALGRVSAAQRDVAGLRASTERQTKLRKKDADGKFMTQLLADMKDPSKFAQKYGARANKDGSVDGFLTFDPNKGQFVVATKEGVTELDQMDTILQVLAARELGEGNVDKGMELMLKATERTDARYDKEYNRALEVAKANMQLYFKGLEAKNDDARTAAYRAGIAARGKGEREVPPELLKQMNDIAVKLGDRNLPPAERAALTAQLRAFQGQAATHLGKTLGMPVPPNRDEDMKQAVELVKAGAAKTLSEAMLQIQSARSGVNPADEAVARLQQMNANAGAARNQPIPRTNVTAPMPMREIRPGASRPEDFLRTAKRGLFGGLRYVYVDPATGEEYSVEEYDQLLGGR